MMLFQSKLHKSVDDAKEANELKIKSVRDKIEIVQDSVDELEKKANDAEKDFGVIKTRLAVIVSEQQHMSKNISHLNDSVEKIFVSGGFGRVVKK